MGLQIKKAKLLYQDENIWFTLFIREFKKHKDLVKPIIGVDLSSIAIFWHMTSNNSDRIAIFPAILQ